MVDLQENILQIVPVKDITRDPCSLGHPVEPDASAAIVNTIFPNVGIDRRMEFYSADLRTRKLTLCPDIVYMIVLYSAESPAHASADAGLLAVEDSIVPYDVRSDILLVPSVAKDPEQHLYIMDIPVPVNIFSISAPDIMACTPLLSKCNSRTF
jgi:hypothetical protein